MTTLQPGQFVVDHDRPTHWGRVIEVVAADGDAKIEFFPHCETWRLIETVDPIPTGFDGTEYPGWSQDQVDEFEAAVERRRDYEAGR